MKSTQYLLAHPLAFIALLAIVFNTVLWGFVADAEGATLWARLAMVGVVSIPALANLVLGLSMRSKAQPPIFFIPASIPALFAIGLFVFRATTTDAQAGLDAVVLLLLQVLVLPLFWALAFLLRRLSGGSHHDLPRMPGTASPTA